MKCNILITTVKYLLNVNIYLSEYYFIEPYIKCDYAYPVVTLMSSNIVHRFTVSVVSLYFMSSSC